MILPLSVEYQIETVQWIYSTREASRTLYFRYCVNKLNRCCLHSVFCQRNQRNPHRFAKFAKTEGNQSERVCSAGGGGMYSLFVVAIFIFIYIYGDRIFTTLFLSRET